MRSFGYVRYAHFAQDDKLGFPGNLAISGSISALMPLAFPRRNVIKSKILLTLRGFMSSTELPPINSYIRRLGKTLLVKFDLAGDVSADELDLCARKTAMRLQTKHGISDYDVKQTWQELLAAREFAKVLAGFTLKDKVGKAIAAHKGMKDMELLGKDVFTKVTNISSKLQLLSPLYWDIPSVTGQAADMKFVRLSMATSAMLVQEEALAKEGHTLADVAKFAVDEQRGLGGHGRS